uniref:MAPK regulated corepressor interacting protein 2 n=1 Tax=Molossus molossus TaxID=27622 RepID=A0A7J8IZV1_MOLMO|nr:MAPK regulated corepressor interacting protein 2 [Molossus molossus]
MADGPLPHLHPSRRPRRPTRRPTRRTSALCPKPGSKWSSSWVVAQLERAVRGLCSMWRGPPTPGCRTLCPSTWMSGGHSSSWPESLTAPSRRLGMNAACTDLALSHGRPSARRGPWHLVYPLQQVVFPLGPGWMPATPEVPAFGLLYLLTSWPSCARLPGARG